MQPLSIFGWNALTINLGLHESLVQKNEVHLQINVSYDFTTNVPTNHFIICQKHHLCRNITTTVSLLATLRDIFKHNPLCNITKK